MGKKIERHIIDTDAASRGIWMRALGANYRFLGKYAGFSTASGVTRFFESVRGVDEKARLGPVPDAQTLVKYGYHRMEASLFYSYLVMLTDELLPDITQHVEAGLLAFEMTAHALAEQPKEKSLNIERQFMVNQAIIAGVIDVKYCKDCRSYVLVADREHNCFSCQSDNQSYVVHCGELFGRARDVMAKHA